MGAKPKRCRAGHELTADNVLIIKEGDWNRRRCRTCRRDYERRLQLRKPSFHEERAERVLVLTDQLLAAQVRRESAPHYLRDELDQEIADLAASITELEGR